MEREYAGLEISPSDGTRMTHFTASEKVTSYTILKDPTCGRVEAVQEPGQDQGRASDELWVRFVEDREDRWRQ